MSSGLPSFLSSFLSSFLPIYHLSIYLVVRATSYICLVACACFPVIYISLYIYIKGQAISSLEKIVPTSWVSGWQVELWEFYFSSVVLKQSNESLVYECFIISLEHHFGILKVTWWNNIPHICQPPSQTFPISERNHILSDTGARNC